MSLHLRPRPRRLASAFALAAAIALGLAASSGPTIAQDASSSATRELWSRGDARFLRTWEILGPIATGLDAPPIQNRACPILALKNRSALCADRGEESALAPSPNPARIGETERAWTHSVSWGDSVDVAGALGAPERRGANAAEEAAYAFATINRAQDGEALLSIGADGAARVWVNGVSVHRRNAQPFSFDSDRARVRLRRGENRILVKLAHRSGPWRFALRVLEPGTIVERIDEIVPHIVTASVDELIFRTDIQDRSQGARVDVAIVGAGGRIAAQRQAARGELVRFGTSAWPDGAYEIRLATRDEQGRRVFSHLPWYKGDAIAAAARLAEAARAAANDVEGAHIRMLAELARDRLGDNPSAAPDDAWALIHSPLMEFEELVLGRRSETGAVRPLGFVRLAWRDETDGSTQFCRAYLPSNYNAEQRRPLVLALHGYNPPNPPYVRFWSVDRRHDSIAERFGLIWIEPHGRANAQYIGIGENDVLHCLDEAKRRLSVDENRIYLMGESMGGAGTWLIAQRHPDLFAAIAPIFGGWDFRLAPGPSNTNNPNATSLAERFAQEAQSSFAGAENLLNVPIYVHHGDADQAVNVAHSRHVVRMLERWGYDIRYEEHPGGAHEDLKVHARIVEWMLAHERNSTPRRVRIRSMDLGGASAHWVSVRGFEAPLTPIELDAEIVAPGRIRLDTRNVASLALKPPRQSLGRGRADSWSVVWNGAERTLALSASGEAILSAPGYPRASLMKRPGLEGRLSNFMTTPFAVIVGTSSRDPEMRRLIGEKAETFADLWTQWQHVRPRVILDRDLTSEDERRYSLMLIGDAESNLVARRMARSLPMSVRRDAVIIGGRAFPAPDSVAQMIYPSPAQNRACPILALKNRSALCADRGPDRYVLLVASTSTAGMHFWNPAGFWHQTFGFHTLAFDWTIQDGRRVTLENGLGAHRAWVAAGSFDARWRRDDRYVFLGDAALRAQSPLRRPPAPGFRLAPEALDAYAGRYRLANGFVVAIAREGESLTLRAPGAPRDRLIPWSENEFALRSNVAPVTFQRDGSGRVVGFAASNDGQGASAARVD